MRLVLQDIYQLDHRAVAKRKLLAWCRWVRKEAKKQRVMIFGSMLRCAKMIEAHLEGILAHWEHGTTNAFLGRPQQRLLRRPTPRARLSL